MRIAVFSQAPAASPEKKPAVAPPRGDRARERGEVAEERDAMIPRASEQTAELADAAVGNTLKATGEQPAAAASSPTAALSVAGAVGARRATVPGGTGGVRGI